MNTENDWGHTTESNMVERQLKRLPRKKTAIAIKPMKPEKAAGLPKVCAEVISASGEAGISVKMESANVC